MAFSLYGETRFPFQDLTISNYIITLKTILKLIEQQKIDIYV